jgi:hypothetical protein
MDLGITLTVRDKPLRRDDVDVSVVIAHRGPEMGLWLTIESCQMALQHSGLTYEFVVVVNGEKELSLDLQAQKHWLTKAGLLQDFVHVPENLSPPSARQIGTWSANGKYLFFLDNHCLVEHSYFTRAVESMKKHNIGVLHSTTKFWTGDDIFYEYHMAFKRHFWVDKCREDAVSSTDPYQVGVAGHGGFAVTREVWDKVDGYWMGFEGYAGEEPYFDLKCWRLGIPVWIDPLMVHRHWAGKRSYNRHYTDDYITNLLMAAHMIGGEKWLYDVSDSFRSSTRVLTQECREPKPIIDLVETAYNRSKQRADWINLHSVRDFEQCLAHFSENNIRI